MRRIKIWAGGVVFVKKVERDRVEDYVKYVEKLGYVAEDLDWKDVGVGE